MVHLNRIAHGINIGSRCFHMIINKDAPLDTHLKSRLFSKMRIRRYPNGKNNHVSRERIGIFKEHLNPITCFPKSFHSMTERKRNTVFARLSMNKGSHVRIKGFHELLRTLNNSDLHTKFAQVFCKLKTNKATTCNNCRTRMGPINKLLHTKRVFDRTKRKNMLKTNTWQAWLRGLCPWRKNEFVVGLIKLFTRNEILNAYKFAFRVKFDDLMIDAHIHIKATQKTLRCLQRKRLRIFNGTANVIWKTAISI